MTRPATSARRLLVLLGAFIITGSLASPASAQAKPGAAPEKPAVEQATKPAAEQTPKPPVGEAHQADEQLPKVDLSVTVTAPRMDIPLKDTPAATAVVSDITLKSVPRGIAAEEVLQMVPGVKVDNQADGERVHLSIRGQGLLTERGIRGITVLLDGIPLNDPTGFAPDLFDVDFSNVSRVEVFRGVASALYGGASAGGIINISTPDGGSSKAGGDVAVTGGSYSFFKGMAAVDGTSGNLNYRVSASANRGDGYRLHTQFDAVNVYGKVRWTPSEKTRLTAIVAGTHYFNENAEGLNLAWTDLGQGVEWPRQANPDALTYNEYQRTQRMTFGLTGHRQLASNQELSFDVFYRRTGWTESVPSSVQHRTYDNPGGNVQYLVHFGSGPVKNYLTMGTDISFQSIDDYKHPNLGGAQEGPEVLSNQTIDQRGLGVYAIDRIEFGRAWSTMVSVRGDSIRNELTDLLKTGGVDFSGVKSFSKATARVGVAWNPRPDVGLFASWGQGFLPPATEELANNPNAMGGFNLSLVPATSVGEDIGVRGGAGRVSYELTFFHLTTENDFGRYRVPSRPLETFYGNVGASRRYGIETSLGYYPMANLALRGAYTFSDFLYTNVQFMFDHYTNTVMPNSPRHQAAFDLEYIAGGRWVFGFNAFGQTMQYVDHSNSMSADGYLLCTPRIAYRWRTRSYNAELSLQARNVFGDEFIAFTEPDPDGNSFHPGPTREVFASLRFGFGR